MKLRKDQEKEFNIDIHQKISDYQRGLIDWMFSDDGRDDRQLSEMGMNDDQGGF